MVSPGRKPWEPGTESPLCSSHPERAILRRRPTMAQTLSQILVHMIFSTKGRRRTITPDLKPRLCAYMTTIVNEEFGYLLRIDGTEDHVHMLVDMKPVTAAATMLRVVKSNSSSWVHETFPQHGAFAWQSGYAAFSVSASQKKQSDRVHQEPGDAPSDKSVPGRTDRVSRTVRCRL